MIISVFGGSRADDATNAVAYELGRRIAIHGHTLKNGGNAGTMEASSKGCVEHGGKVIGALFKSTTVPGLMAHNPYSTETRVFDSYLDRVKFLLEADRVIALPGQIGTLDEILAAWVDAVVNDKPPVLLVGQKNKELLDFLFAKNYVKQDEHARYVLPVASLDEIEFLPACGPSLP